MTTASILGASGYTGGEVLRFGRLFQGCPRGSDGTQPQPFGPFCIDIYRYTISVLAPELGKNTRSLRIDSGVRNQPGLIADIGMALVIPQRISYTADLR